ncbi:MAG: NAD-dependent epimerase/dehydratase family protein, partial [Desulfovibrio sp.]
PETRLDRQVFMDLRQVGPEVFQGVDAVVHLAGISNDPMGNRFSEPTTAINDTASVALAQMAKNAGVRSFVFASSCSMYGSASADARSEQDSLNPLTAYARSKVAMEEALSRLAGPDFTATCLRFPTACGMSERLRLDLVLNDFVASAVATGTITVLSDGSPWRPLIHVRDMARAVSWALDRDPAMGGDFVAVNTGSDEWNYTIKDLALACADVIGGVDVEIAADGMPDKRSYRVDFARFRELAPDHQPQVSLVAAIQDLLTGLRAMEFSTAGFRDTWFMRLKVLTSLMEQGLLSPDLYWTRNQGQRP